jgi:hypothetical protein
VSTSQSAIKDTCLYLYLPYGKRLSHSQLDFCSSCKSGFSDSRPFPDGASQLTAHCTFCCANSKVQYNEPLLRRYTQIKCLTSDRLIWIECKQRALCVSQHSHKHNHKHRRFLLDFSSLSNITGNKRVRPHSPSSPRSRRTSKMHEYLDYSCCGGNQPNRPYVRPGGQVR